MKKYDIVVLSGGFDPLHRGHIRLFKAAKSMGYKIIVGLNSDKWLVKKKGQVFMNYAERAEILNAIQYIDEVMSFNDEDGTAMELLYRIKTLYPECSIAFGNGGNTTPENVPEKTYCKAYKIDMLWNLGGGLIKKAFNEEVMQNLQERV